MIPLRLPALRERMQDIEPLARDFFSGRGYKKTTLSPAALAELMARSWQGNIRELFNVLERAAIIAAGGLIEREHLLLDDDMTAVVGAQSRAWSVIPAAPEPAPAGNAVDKIAPGISVREMEEKLIWKTLAEVRNNRTEAAKLLGISVRTLRNKLKQYRLRQCQMEA